MSERIYSLVLDRLIETKGAVVNRHLDADQTAFEMAYPRQQKLSER
jgi:hypothetical protein